MAVIAGRRFSTPDLLVVGAGVTMLAGSLLPWYGYDADGWHPTYTAYQSGFLAFFPTLIVVLVAGTTAVRAWSGAQLPSLGDGRASWSVVWLAADALAALMLVAFWVTIPPLDGVTVGAKVGVVIGLVAVIGQCAGALLARRSAGVSDS